MDGVAMKHFKDAQNNIFAYESDGSQDAFIRPGLTPITEEELAALRAPTQEQMRDFALVRINAAYQATIDALTAGYPVGEVESWAKQETEARAYMADNLAPTPWIDAAAAARGMEKPELINRIIQKADLFAPFHGYYTGIRQKLEDEINALPGNATQAQYDAIQWNT
jgi:hypothetical protein